MGRELDGGHAREALRRRATGRVRCSAGRAASAHPRGEVDDATPSPLLDEHTRCRLCHEERPPTVDRVHPVPHFDALFEQTRMRSNRRVVDTDTQATKALDGGLDDARRTIDVADICDYCCDPWPHDAFCLGQASNITVRGDDAGARPASTSSRSGRLTHRRWRCESVTALIISCTRALCAKLPWLTGPSAMISQQKSCTRLP